MELTLGQKIVKMRTDNPKLSYQSIAKRVGCSISTVSYHMSKESRENTLERVRGHKLAMRKHVRTRKSESPCMDCGQWYPYFLMDWDHRPDEKKTRNISHINEFSSIEDLDSEIAKCDLVCSNCHRMRTWQRLVTGGNQVDWDQLERFPELREALDS